MPYTALSPQEFIERARLDKAAFLDELNGWMLSTKCEAAEAKRQYYLVSLTDSKDPRVPFLRSEMESLDMQAKGLEHSVSALQSTLRTERQMTADYSSDR